MNLKKLKENHFLFTSESFTEGNSDKLCDYISDSILDAFISLDEDSHVACECMAFDNTILVMGEITSKAIINIEDIVRNSIKEIGYDDIEKGLDYKTCEIMIKITKQSPDIFQAIVKNHNNKNHPNKIDNNQHIIKDNGKKENINKENPEKENLCNNIDIKNKENKENINPLINNPKNKQYDQINFNDSEKEQDEICAGDQGNMFGYATDETEQFFPFSHLLALQLSEKLSLLRKNGDLCWLRPDGKIQVTVEYKKENNHFVPLRIENICIICQHDPNISLDYLKIKIIENLIFTRGSKHEIDEIEVLPNKDIERKDSNFEKKKSSNKVNMGEIIPEGFLDQETKIIINPQGQFIKGGPAIKVGLTGRKIIADTYGGFATHGGGAFSGKDCTKVDRSAAYAARWIAKSLVFSGLCKRVLVQISYSIGLSDPLSIYIDSYGTVTGGKKDLDLYEIVVENFNLKPGKIIQDLKLKNAIFKKTSVYGHFGRKKEEFTWEKPKLLHFTKKI